MTILQTSLADTGWLDAHGPQLGQRWAGCRGREPLATFRAAKADVLLRRRLRSRRAAHDGGHPSGRSCRVAQSACDRQCCLTRAERIDGPRTLLPHYRARHLLCLCPEDRWPSRRRRVEPPSYLSKGQPGDVARRSHTARPCLTSPGCS